MLLKTYRLFVGAIFILVIAGCAIFCQPLCLAFLLLFTVDEDNGAEDYKIIGRLALIYSFWILSGIWMSCWYVLKSPIMNNLLAAQGIAFLMLLFWFLFIQNTYLWLIIKGYSKAIAKNVRQMFTNLILRGYLSYPGALIGLAIFGTTVAFATYIR